MGFRLLAVGYRLDVSLLSLRADGREPTATHLLMTAEPTITPMGGRGHGKFSRGYKLHALVTEDGRIKQFVVRPMNEAEPRVSRELIMPQLPPGLVVIGDGNYDSKFLYEIVRERGSWFFAPPKQAPQQRRSWKKTNAARREAVEVWEQQPKLARAVYKLRTEIDVFSRLSCFGGGLAPLPAWVRRLGRVTLWVTGKIAIYHARLLLRERRKAAA